MTTPTIVLENNKYQTVEWNLASGEAGEEVRFGEHDDKSVQITATLGGATFALQGSMDGDNWSTLTKQGVTGAGRDIDGAGLFRIQQNPKFIRPNVTGGDGTTAVKVVLGFSTLV